jgi:hypothetical protein
MPRYEEPEEGEWVQPVEKGYKFACCDCGKVHMMDFRVVDGRVQFRVFDAPRSTGQIRRYRHHIATIDHKAQ